MIHARNDSENIDNFLLLVEVFENRSLIDLAPLQHLLKEEVPRILSSLTKKALLKKFVQEFSKGDVSQDFKTQMIDRMVIPVIDYSITRKDILEIFG
jgi:hypothetical protein